MAGSVSSSKKVIHLLCAHTRVCNSSGAPRAAGSTLSWKCAPGGTGGGGNPTTQGVLCRVGEFQLLSFRPHGSPL